MKYSLLFVILCFAIGGLFAQPDFSVVTSPQEVIIGSHDAMFFLDQDVGWLVGSETTILKTTDGGQTWTVQSHIPMPDTTFYNILFIDSNTGWAVGADGVIWKSENGGDTWIDQSPTGITTNTLTGIAPVDANVVYISGDDGVVLKTTDGGANWTDISVAAASSSDFDAIYAFDANNIVCMSNSNDATIAQSADGGTTWNVMFAPFSGIGISQRMYAMAGDPGGTAYIAAYHGNIFKTTDYGQTWTNVADMFGPLFKILYSIEFDGNDVWAAGSDGKFYFSEDGGAVWDTLAFPSTNNVQYIGFFEPSLYAFGTYGQFFESADMGASWVPVLSWPNLSFYTISAPSVNKIVAGSITGGEVTVTNDGGQTWSYPVTPTPEMVGDILDLFFLDENTGFFAGRNAQIGKTTDGGVTWDMKPNSQFIYGNNKSYYFVYFLDANTGFAGGSSGIIQTTTDGGESWTEGYVGATATLYDCYFIDANTGIVSGSSGRIYKTTDGGANWSEVVDLGTMTMRSIDFIDNTTGFISASSGYIFKTTDAGDTWTQLAQLANANSTGDDPDLYQIYFTSATTGYICGEDGAIYESTDGGDNWVQLNTPPEVLAEALEGMAWPSSTVGFISTQNGYIIATGVSGIQSSNPIADGYLLSQNYPNPFNPETVIGFNLPKSEEVTLTIYNTLGQTVRTLYTGSLPAGYHTVSWNGANDFGLQSPSGIYFYQLKAGNFSQVNKMMLMR